MNGLTGISWSGWHVCTSNFVMQCHISWACTIIINLTCMFFFMYINLIILYSFNAKNESAGDYSVDGALLEITQEFLLHPTHRCAHFMPICLMILVCNMHIQLLSFKICCLSQRFHTISALEFKSTSASWNVTLSCSFLSLSLWLAQP